VINRSWFVLSAHAVERGPFASLFFIRRSGVSLCVRANRYALARALRASLAAPVDGAAAGGTVIVSAVGGADRHVVQ